MFQSSIRSLPLLHRGKVRDIYAAGDDLMLIVTTDRLSAFDVILPDPIPGKGAVLTALSNFWFRRMQDLIPNHLSDRPISDVVQDASLPVMGDEVLHPNHRSFEVRVHAQPV